MLEERYKKDKRAREVKIGRKGKEKGLNKARSTYLGVRKKEVEPATATEKKG